MTKDLRRRWWRRRWRGRVWYRGFANNHGLKVDITDSERMVRSEMAVARKRVTGSTEHAGLEKDVRGCEGARVDEMVRWGGCVKCYRKAKYTKATIKCKRRICESCRPSTTGTGKRKSRQNAHILATVTGGMRGVRQREREGEGVCIREAIAEDRVSTRNLY